MKNIFLFFIFSTAIALASGQSYEMKTDILYRTDVEDEYIQEQCKLDLFYPSDKSAYTTVVWFHGGGLTGGQKEIPEFLKEKGVAVVGVGYRFSPKVSVSEIIQDAAHAVKWVSEHIEELGGDKRKIILAGHSAGAYLNLMLALNKAYLSDVGLDANDLMGVVPFSAQCITHFTARSESGYGINQPIIDELAPLYWVRADAPPITLITGDRELEMVGRYEENAYLKRMLTIVGHDQTALLELDGFDHGMTYPAFPLLIKEVERLENAAEKQRGKSDLIKK